MGKQVKSNKIIKGTYGNVWINNELLAEVDAAEAIITLEYEEVNMAGDLATHQVLVGWKGEGSITLKKVFSRGLILLGNIPKTGIVPEISIIFAIDDPDAHGAERVSVSEVTFEEIMLAKFELKKPGSEELKFKFADYDLIDLITT